MGEVGKKARVAYVVKIESDGGFIWLEIPNYRGASHEDGGTDGLNNAAKSLKQKQDDNETIQLRLYAGHLVRTLGQVLHHLGLIAGVHNNAYSMLGVL